MGNVLLLQLHPTYTLCVTQRRLKSRSRTQDIRLRLRDVWRVRSRKIHEMDLQSSISLQRLLRRMIRCSIHSKQKKV